MVYCYLIYYINLNKNGCPIGKETYSTANDEWETMGALIFFRIVESVSWGFHMPLSLLLSSSAHRKAIYKFFSIKQD